MKRSLLLLGLFLYHGFILGQEDIHLDIEQIMEEVFPIQDRDANYEELYEALLLLYSHPLDLNVATREDLQSLFVLSESQINSFVTYRSTYGKLLSIYELQAVPEFDQATINRLLPFVTIREGSLTGDNRSLIAKILNEQNNYLLLRYDRTLEEKKGYTPPDSNSVNRYSGSPDRLYARFRVNHSRDFSLGFTAEKDAGEALTMDKNTSRYGADFYSYHIQVQNRGRIKNLILGDYQIQFGQGLVFGAGFNIGKGAESVTTTRRTNFGMLPYTSVVETGFFRGAGATVEISRHLELTGMYSRLGQDAIERSDETRRFVSSIQTSGFHRTPNEINAKNTVDEENTGLNLTLRKKRWTAGANVLFTRYSLPIVKAGSLANQYEFSGDHNQVYSGFISYNYQNFSLFGEVGRSSSGGTGTVAGLIAALSKKLETALVFRNYDRNFHSFYGDAFGELSRNINELGYYWGLKYTHNRKISFSCYYDSFAFGWVRSSTSAPSTGYEYLFRINYDPMKTSRLFFQYRRQSRGENVTVEDLDQNVRITEQGVKDNYILNLDHVLSERISFKSRIQWSSFDFFNTSTSGFAIAQDLNINFTRWRLSGRLALFDTDNFDNRQYIFERDVLYSFSIPALSGRGTRQYLVLQYKASRKLDFWLKYARTHFRDRDAIGSGLEQIDGNQRTLVRFQTRIRI